MTVLTDKQEPFVGAVRLAGMPTNGTSFLNRAGFYQRLPHNFLIQLFVKNTRSLPHPLPEPLT